MVDWNSALCGIIFDTGMDLESIVHHVIEKGSFHRNEYSVVI